MHFSLSFIASVALTLTSMVSGAAISGRQDPAAGSFVVKYKTGALTANRRLAIATTETFDGELLSGFSAKLDEATVKKLLSDPNVESVSAETTFETSAVQSNAPWGLQRISADDVMIPGISGTEGMTYTYNYEEQAGEGIDVYVLDTGIQTTHTEFGGRAVWGHASFGLAKNDKHGHGTHVAGIVGSGRFGVAKKSKIIAVKVLNDFGFGSTASVLSGLQYTLKAAKASGKPSVALLSFTGRSDFLIDFAVERLTKAGITVVVAAGNANADVAAYSPAHVASVVTVGATTIEDARSPTSNFGKGVDIFAPGAGVMSTWIGSNTASKALSGTSMAAAHVAGIVALNFGMNGPMAPNVVQVALQFYGLNGILSNIPADTANILASNDQ